MVALPRDYLAQTGLGPEAVVIWEIEGNGLVMRPIAVRPRYTLAELLAQCDTSKRRSKSDQKWTTSRPIGHELI
jgi:antitoxin ChpS